VNALVQELIELTGHLTALVERELAILKGNRPSALNVNDDERATMLALYAKRCVAFKREVPLASLSAETKTRLTMVTEKLRAALREESRWLARFRHVSEGLIKAIADEVAARESPAAYAKAGVFTKTASGAASAMTYNRTI
jgi:hypothetical protein